MAGLLLECKNVYTVTCLRLNIPIPLPAIDPRKSSDWIAPYFHFALFEGLTRCNADGSIVLAQAQSVEVSPDQTHYLFRLRDTVWSNGSPVTAEDFARSWREMRGPDTYLLANVALAESLGPRTLSVTLRKPMSYFLEITATSPLLPFRNERLFNGAFCLDGMALHKNPFYRRAERVQLQQIDFSLIPDREEALRAYEAGELDLVGSPLSMFALPPDVPHLEFPASRSRALFFNTRDEPFRHADVRRAFARKDKSFFEKRVRTVSLLHLNEPTAKETARTLQHDWANRLDIRVILEQTDLTTLHERIQAGSFSMALLSLVAKYRNPMNLLERFQDPNCPRNYCKWDSPAYRALLDRGDLAGAEQLLAVEVPFVTLYESPHRFLIGPHVRGFSVSPLGITYLEEISII